MNLRAPALLALAAGALAVSAGTADAAITPSLQDRTLVVTGDAASDRLTLRIPTIDPTRLQLDVGDDGTADFTFPRSQFDAVRVLAGAGNDVVKVDDPAIRGSAPIPVTADGQAGNDTLSGGRGADQLAGGDGNDVVDGNGGDDTISLGAGIDAASWDAGDGLDTFDGGTGFDRLAVTSGDTGEQLRALADGARARLTRDGAAFADVTTLERIDLAARDGDDAVTIGDLTGTGVQEIHDNAGAGADTLSLLGTPGGDVVNLLASGPSTAVLGLPVFFTVDGADTTDKVTIDARAGNDRISGPSTAVPFAFTAIGSDGDDILGGSPGADTLLAGNGKDFADPGKGDDTVRLGDGDDILATDAGDGRDHVDGEAGRDSITLSGSAAKETYSTERLGSGVRVTRETDQIDGGTMEALSLFSFGGADTMLFGDLTGTGITSVNASLFDFAVPGGAVDKVTIEGTTGDDSIRALTNVSGVQVSGLPATYAFTGAVAPGDELTIGGGDGDDRIDGADLGPASFRLFEGGGNGDDQLLGGPGDDVLFGNAGDDIAFAGVGDDLAFGLEGDDLLVGESGDDVLDGGVGTDRLLGGPGQDVLLNGEAVTPE